MPKKLSVSWFSLQFLFRIYNVFQFVNKKRIDLCCIANHRHMALHSQQLPYGIDSVICSCFYIGKKFFLSHMAELRAV